MKTILKYALAAVAIIIVVGLFAAWRMARTPPGPGDKAWQAMIEKQGWSRWTDPGGYRLHYIEAGQGPPVVLLHGYGDRAYTWHLNIPALVEAGHHVLAWDLPGLGRSETPPGFDFSAEAVLGQLIRFLDIQGLDRVAVVGSSLGGNLALLLAVRHPERVSKVVAVDPAAYPSKRHASYQRLARWPLLVDLLRPFVGKSAIRYGLTRSYHDPSRVDEAGVSERAQVLRRPDFMDNMVKLGANYFSASHRILVPRYPDIQAPVLIVWGDDDRLIPVAGNAERLHRDIPGSKLVLLEKAGHAAHEEQAAAFNRAVIDFLAAP
ncbi:MAG: alpha/beta hydrolase [Proteobacteria bacterium]|nr:alpha/beta hydrolase [Pseudomonadota bacterium]